MSRRIASGRGLSRYVRFISRFFSSENLVTIWVENDAKLTVPMRDAYWLGPLLTNSDYEPEVGRVLSVVLTDTSAFVDCGANVGYWSVIASRRIRYANRIVAIEASSHVYALLVKNAEANGDAFRCVHAAVWSEDGMILRIASDAERHSWGSVDSEVRDRLIRVGFKEQEVTSTTIDSQIEMMGDPDLIVLKIDVEGAEAAALAGAKETLRRNSLVIYEEHGRDAYPVVSNALVQDYGLALFRCDHDLKFRSVSLATIAEARPDRTRGYNFFACRPGSDVHSKLLRELSSDM